MLSAYRVLDLSDERGLLCGHILGQLGADIVHVEPPEQREPSTTWWAYARGSRSVALDLDDPGDRQRFFDLVRGADALIESADPGSWERRGLGYERLAAINPALVWVSITPFGSHGPKANYAATDLIVQAAAGTVDLCGPVDRPPLRTAGITAWAHAGAEAAGGTLIALAEARRSGSGQRVEVSAQRAKNLASFFNLQNERIGHKRVERSGSGFQMCGVTFPFVWPAADGFISLTVALDAGNKPFLDRLLAYMREEDAVDVDLATTDWTAKLRGIRSGGAAQYRPPAPGRRHRGVPRRPHEGRPHGRGARPAAAARAGLDLRGHAQQPPAGRTGLLAGGGHTRRAARTPAGPPGPRGAGPAGEPTPAPTVGQHTEEVLAETRDRVAARATAEPASAVGAAVAPGGTVPLAGIKVLDMMWVMAGPSSTGVLAQYGATVVRIENAARIDTVRLLAPYYGGKPGREKSLPFGSINAAKLSVTLDPNHAEAREVILDLVRWADVVTESFSPKAMKAWGLDYESLRKVKPDLIMLSSCLFGQDGPYSLMAGYGTMGSAIGGMVQPTGWPDQSPAGPYGAYTDACSPRISTAVLLAAVEHRRRTGEGMYIDQSQIEASLHYMTPAILDHQLNGTSWDRLGNDDPDLSPHAVYRADGDNEWVAVAVRDEADWRALAATIGRPEWVAGPELASVEGRRLRRDEIDAAITVWTSGRSPSAAEAELQSAGVPAHAVLHAGCPEDAQLAHLRHLVTVAHEGQPDRLVERSRIELTRTPPEPSHVPAMGQHTAYVLRDLLGYTPARLEHLRSVGALGGEPHR